MVNGQRGSSDTGQVDQVWNAKNYVVAIFDVLGQSEVLQKHARLPDIAAGANSEFEETLKQTLGRVLKVRKTFSNFYDSFESRSGLTKTLDSSSLSKSGQSPSSVVKIQQFSDTVVIYRSLAPSDGNIPMRAVFSMMTAAASTMMTCLAHRIPIRGALELGWGVEIADGDIYGGVLERAHFLERQVAKYPRVLVGSELINYLHAWCSTLGNSPIEELNRRLAVECMPHISTDTDGKSVVDFLGDLFRNAYPDIKDRREVANAIAEFANDELAKHADRPEIAAKYLGLSNYLQSRSSN